MPTSTDVAQITYPQSDGQPIADNTKQFRWIVTIQGGLDALFRADPQVVVAGDLLWYPIEGHPETCMAPDVMVAFGHPKGDRGSYLQWEEGGIAPQVVFEIRSPGNTIAMQTRTSSKRSAHGTIWNRRNGSSGPSYTPRCRTRLASIGRSQIQSAGFASRP